MAPSRRISIRKTRASSAAARVLGTVACALVVLALVPTVAWAWTPGTHILLGEAVLRSATLLPPAIAALLRAHPHEFLYGSIAADTSIAKKYAKFGRHCHSWAVGLEILDQARDEPVRAFAYGYLAHLAADTVAHNYFVPHQLAVTSSTSALGHSYWESRFETHIGDTFPRRAHEIVLLDHSSSDEHLDRILSPTIFSTSTNRRIFRGMVYVTDTGSWQRIFMLMAENSRWDLEEREVSRYLTRSFDFVMDFLVRDAGSEPYRLDPSGDRALRSAKLVRRAAMRSGGDAVRTEAQREFGLPPSDLAFTRSIGAPLYVPALAPRS